MKIENLTLCVSFHNTTSSTSEELRQECLITHRVVDDTNIDSLFIFPFIVNYVSKSLSETRKLTRISGKLISLYNHKIFLNL